ncbi:MAG: integrase [Firmicutes bacterium]|nr:integrase [Bacillota bacterium]
MRETELQGATVKAINQMVGLSDTMIDRLMENIRMALADDNTGELETLNSLMAEKQKKLVRLAHAKKDYTDLAIEIDNLREKKQGLLAKRAERKGMQKRIQEMEEFLRSQPEKLTEYDEQMVRRYIQEIIISDDNFKVKFKAGMEVDIAR